MISTSLSSADVSHLTNAHHYDETTTLPPPPRPYAFSYAAGRFSGHIDRTHSEVSDGTGVVRGAFSYIDPRQEIRSVEYVADDKGFHPILSHPSDEPQQSEAVKQATIRHLEQYNRIAERNAQVRLNQSGRLKLNRTFSTHFNWKFSLFNFKLFQFEQIQWFFSFIGQCRCATR